MKFSLAGAGEPGEPMDTVLGRAATFAPASSSSSSERALWYVSLPDPGLSAQQSIAGDPWQAIGHQEICFVQLTG